MTWLGAEHPSPASLPWLPGRLAACDTRSESKITFLAPDKQAPFAYSNAGMHTTAGAPRAITCTRDKDQASTVTSVGMLPSRLRRSTNCEIQRPARLTASSH